jgi:tetratricopeptide (TPR) repeat protein
MRPGRRYPGPEMPDRRRPSARERRTGSPERRAAPARRAGAGRRSGDGHTGLPREVVEEVRGAARRGSGPEAVAALAAAVEALERGRVAEAERAGARAKAAAPRSATVREVLGMALYRRERYREALRELQAYRRMTGRADQNHLIADSYRALGSPEKAPPLAQEALRAQIPPEVRAEAVVVAAAALGDLGRFEEALTLLRRFPTRGETARPHDLRVWYVAGDVLERAGRLREAAREFRRVVDHDPDAFDAAERLAAISDR